MNETPCLKFSVSGKRFKDEKTKQPKIPKDITNSVCALLNCGGTIEFSPEAKQWDNENEFKRRIEQMIGELINNIHLCKKTNWCSGKHGKLVLKIEKKKDLSTAKYNLHLPSDSQVLSVQPCTKIEEVRELLTEPQIPKENAKKIGDHHKKFVVGEKFRLQESKKVQLKLFKDKPTKNVSLRQRFNNNKNKVIQTITAQANMDGGDIYCGIADNGDITGEIIPKKTERDKITADIAKAIDTMIWPEEHRKPKQGEQWDIYFEPVEDHEGNYIPNCFVIVISVAPSPSGVFTEQPESYYIGDDGKVEKMPFEMWKAKLLATTTSGKEEHVNASPQQADETIGSKAESLGRSSLAVVTERESKEVKESRQHSQEIDGLYLESPNSSSAKVTQKGNGQQFQEIVGLDPETSNSSSPTVTQNEYTRLNEKFDRLRENGEWELFWNEIESLRKSESIDVQLIAYYQSTCATYTHKDLKKCKTFRKEFKKLIKTSKNSTVFTVEALFMKAAMRRSEEGYKDSAMILSRAVALAATITPGLTTAWVHCMYAVARTILAKDAGDSEEAGKHVDEAKQHFRKAREHAEKLDEFPKAKRDLTENVLINEALLDLGSCVRGKGLLSASPLSIEKISTLQENLRKEMEQASQLTDSQCRYYFILHELMQCDLNYRLSQLQQRRKIAQFLEIAKSHAKTAMVVAMENGFPELTNYSRNRLAYLAIV